MNSKEHLDWLDEGVFSWNIRRGNSDFLPNFYGVDFRNKSLAGIKLHNADLEGAKFQYADLQSADLSNAILVGAFMESVRLERANLRKSNMSGCYLHGANLQNANLQLANFHGAHFHGAKLDGAIVRTELLTENDELSMIRRPTDLSNTNGLTQLQLNSMNGDTGTLLPTGLEYPTHWPDISTNLDFLSVAETSAEDADNKEFEPSLLRQANVVIRQLALGQSSISQAQTEMNILTNSARGALSSNEIPDLIILLEGVGDAFGGLYRQLRFETPSSEPDLKLLDSLRSLDMKVEKLTLALNDQKKNQRKYKQVFGDAYIESLATNLGKGTGLAITSAIGLTLGYYGSGTVANLVDSLVSMWPNSIDPPKP